VSLAPPAALPSHCPDLIRSLANLHRKHISTVVTMFQSDEFVPLY
jgi:hypothetical protein